MASRVNVCMTISGLFGVVFLTAGISLIYVFRDMIKSEIKREVTLKEDTDTFNDWKELPVPIYFQVWVFDIVNHDEVIKNGEKPTVVQRGPYTYREHREKVNITFCENSTVTYREDTWYVFQRDMSAGPESDTFTTVNIPFLTIVNMIRFEYNFIQELVNLLLGATGERLFIQLSVSDLLWGYEDNLLRDADEILKSRLNTTIDDRFGLFHNKNGSDDGVYNIYTGVQDSSRFGMITSWNYNSSLYYWTNNATNMINGTDGTLYPPFHDKTESIYVFASDLCRSLYARYNYTYSYKDIVLDRYIIPKETFIADKENPINYGFCTPAGNCLPFGLLNVSRCREGAPIVMSQPHFLNVNQTVIDGVNGVHPIPKEHQTVFDLEPMTGVVMNVAKKLQINVFVEPVRDIQDTEKINPVFLPVLWLNESATVDDALAEKFRNKVQEPVNITEAVQYSLVTLGLTILICVIAMVIYRAACSKRDIPLQNMGQDQDPLLSSQ